MAVSYFLSRVSAIFCYGFYHATATQYIIEIAADTLNFIEASRVISKTIKLFKLSSIT